MNIKDLSKDDFFENNGFNDEDFDKANITWEGLSSIGEHHQNQISVLKNVALSISSLMQEIPQVHSVRWRVKDTEHLMAKIVRKKLEGISGSGEVEGKYKNICVENYQDIITDLVGIRALHLFKLDFIEIDDYIKTHGI